ncbi:dipeptidase [Hyalangium rubrum]|uniref:Dipeptidase n=1 Tax=Hyalangium rubrum TaxID=3103134 RepID=A0ABU5H2F5_9BACT|nr:dipeptidase [Hyalangium sp. s54d21]MDY7227565.1 dipeptidase [Hyalangium sp. s54d21]
MSPALLTALLLAGAPASEARAVHESALIIDGHMDTPLRLLDEGFDLGSDTPVTEGHVDLGKARAGNLGAVFFSIWVDPAANQGRYAHRALRLIDAVLMQIERHPDQMVLALSAQDIIDARASQPKKLASLMGIEGGHVIENDLGLLRDFYRLGARYMTLTWSNTNEWADSSGDIQDRKVKHHGGLSPFGEEVVREMNRLGMLVDISHVSDETFFDTLKVTRAPVIASHSSARALTQSPRNMTDDMLRAVAANKGVVMVNFFSAFIDDAFRKAQDAQNAERKAALAAQKARLKKGAGPLPVIDMATERQWSSKLERPPLEALIDHIDHVAKVAGVDHVGLGSDFDGVSSTPEGIDSVADLPRITEALLARGYSPEQVHKILGGNLLRVFREAERVSRELRAAPPPR